MEKLDSQYPTDALAEALAVSESGLAAHRRKAQRSAPTARCATAFAHRAKL